MPKSASGEDILEAITCALSGLPCFPAGSEAAQAQDVVLHWGQSESVIYAIGIISTVSSGPLGLGAPLLWGYIIYLSFATGGVLVALAMAGATVMWPALLLQQAPAAWSPEDHTTAVEP